MSVHLDPARWQALLVTPEPELLAHLEAGCDLCDDFLASVPGLEGEVDRALFALAPRPPSTDELSWARFRRRHRAPRRLFIAAAALALLASASWALFPAAEPSSGIKGSGRAQLELRAALGASGGALTLVDDGAQVPASAALVFQVRSNFAGPARFFVQRGASAPVELAQLGLVEGAQELEASDDGLLGFSLRGERGPLQLWLVASESPLPAEAALAAIQSGASEGVALGHVRVEVVDP